MFRNIHLGGKTKEKWEVVAIKDGMVVTLAERGVVVEAGI